MVSPLLLDSANFVEMNGARACAGIAAENGIYMYSIANKALYPKGSTGLCSPLQTVITSLSWNPFGNAVFAVGCKNGVFLWRLIYDPNVHFGNFYNTYTRNYW